MSGVDAPAGWTSAVLGEVCELRKGSTPSMKAVPGEYPLVVTGAERRSSNSFEFNCEAVCVPLVSSTGHGHASIHRVHFQSGKFALANIMLAIIPKSDAGLLPRFLHLLLSAKKDELLVPLMAGTSNVSLRIPDLAGVRFHLPAVQEQERIVAVLDETLRKLDEARRLSESISSDFDRLLMALAYREQMFDAPKVPMRNIAPLVRRPVTVALDGSYPELGVRSFGKGTFHKSPISGTDVRTKKLFWIEPGDLVFQIVFAWEGAVAIAQDADRGRCGSHRFLTCVCDKGRVLADWLLFYFLTPRGLSELGEASPGGAGRNRTLGLEKLASIHVPVPPLEHQHMIASAMAAKRKHLSEHRFSGDADSLRRAILAKAFRGEL